MKMKVEIEVNTSTNQATQDCRQTKHQQVADSQGRDSCSQLLEGTTPGNIFGWILGGDLGLLASRTQESITTFCLNHQFMVNYFGSP